MKELIEKKNDLITRAEDVLNLAKSEKRELTEAEAEELAEIRDNVRKIVETINLNNEIRELDKMKVKEDANPQEEEEEVTEERAIEIKQKETEKIEREQFENFIRGHIVHERAGELTPATSGTGIGLGGVLIPKTIVNYIIKKVYDICPILDKSQKFNVKGTLEVPYYPAGANNINVAYQTEFTPMASSSGSFATVCGGRVLPQQS